MINSITRPEILAPCGSYEILIAAVKAGADACYIGGNRFSARAYATNLAQDDVTSAIDYAHLHDTKLYLTVNTLFKNNEIQELVDYLKPYYEAGLDAVIVQDLGAFSVIKEYFPDLPIHCSTQMNINSLHAAAMMKEQGAARVVTAREMSLEEIRKIKDSVEIEIETFVHGAMCYSYSGQCLMSSLAGGRSGNRGRCAQPCRKCYDNQYLLSMKDLCALPNIPELLLAGIDSLKIEGRMKNAYYVASAVDAYREIVLDVMNQCFDKKKAYDYQKKLADIFNRGGFTQGYFFQHNGENMISKFRPNNQGTCIGTIKNTADGKVRILLEEELFKGDVLELPLKDATFIEITSPDSFRKGEIVTLAAPKTRMITGGSKVYRTKCKVRLEQIDTKLRTENKKTEISLSFRAKIGEPLCISLRLDGSSFKDDFESVTITDDIVEPSNNCKLDIEQIRSKISMLGDTDYFLRELTIDTDPDSFVPMSKVKHLRREILKKYEQIICSKFRRKTDNRNFIMKEFHSNQSIPINGYMAYVQTMNQLHAVLECENINSICMDMRLFNEMHSDASMCQMLASKDIIISLPYIIDSQFDLATYLPNYGIRGIYIRNIDGFAAVYEACKTFALPKGLIVIGAASLYTFNDYATAFWQSLIPDIVFEAGYELNGKEFNQIANKPAIAQVYGHQQVMLSAQCVKGSKGACDHNFDVVKIKDDKSNWFYAKCMCDQCYNVIYNGRSYCMLDKEQELMHAVGAKILALSFTIEDYGRTKEVLHFLDDKTMIQPSSIYFTNGHFYRGVE